MTSPESDYRITCPLCGGKKWRTSKTCNPCKGVAKIVPMQQPDDPMIRYIPLTKGQYATVDVWWYDWLMQWKWHASWDDHTKSFYAKRNRMVDGKWHGGISMHREILGLSPDDPRIGDHKKSGETLNNRRSNLRVVNFAQNRQNARNTRGEMAGITYDASSQSYRVRIAKDGKSIFLGRYKELMVAQSVRKAAEHRYYGEFACGPE